jgi:uncharacterized cupredoxin-like copper-binding protein
MELSMRTRWVTPIVVAVALTACTPGAEPTVGSPPDSQGAVESSSAPAAPDDAPMSSEGMAMGAAGADEFAFGEPADPAAAERTIDVRTVEQGGFHYEPDAIEVAAGETVTFRVRNDGEAVHEFVLGDERVQEEHEAEMQAMGSEAAMAMAEDPNAVSVPPGGSRSLTWTFANRGRIVYGCHQPGHYAAGMRGDLDITS